MAYFKLEVCFSLIWLDRVLLNFVKFSTGSKRLYSIPPQTWLSLDELLQGESNIFKNRSFIYYRLIFKLLNFQLKCQISYTALNPGAKNNVKFSFYRKKNFHKCYLCKNVNISFNKMYSKWVTREIAPELQKIQLTLDYEYFPFIFSASYIMRERFLGSSWTFKYQLKQEN